MGDELRGAVTQAIAECMGFLAPLTGTVQLLYKPLLRDAKLGAASCKFGLDEGQVEALFRNLQDLTQRFSSFVDALRALPDRCLPAGWGCGRQTTARVVELRRARSEAL